jgi:hypothetical protein
VFILQHYFAPNSFAAVHEVLYQMHPSKFQLNNSIQTSGKTRETGSVCDWKHARPVTVWWYRMHCWRNAFPIAMQVSKKIFKRNWYNKSSHRGCIQLKLRTLNFCQLEDCDRAARIQNFQWLILLCRMEFKLDSFLQTKHASTWVAILIVKTVEYGMRENAVHSSIIHLVCSVVTTNCSIVVFGRDS